MVTAQQVYDTALVLIDEVSELGGLIPDTPKYYQTKAVHIINLLQAELLPAGEEIEVISNLSQSVKVADKVAISVLPYGVAAHLILSEDPGVASFLNNRYDELKRKQVTKIQPITDAYDSTNGMR